MNSKAIRFFREHYGTIAAIAGLSVLALCAWPAVSSYSVPRAKAQSDAKRLAAASPSEALKRERRVRPELPQFETIAPPAEDAESFLMTAKRVFCTAGDPKNAQRACGRPIPAMLLDGEKPVCPFCGVEQPTKKKIVLDTDGDGIPDDWERAHGLNPEDPKDVDSDPDGDGFTVAEEYAAGTDVRDASSHPDYLDRLSLAGPIEAKSLPIYCSKAIPIPNGHRFEIRRCRDEGVLGRVLAGEPIPTTKGAPSGWFVTNYVHSVKKVVAKGATMGGAEAMKDVNDDSIEFVRVSDGKRVPVKLGRRNAPLEISAKLAFTMPKGFDGKGADTLAVREGTRFSLYGGRYAVQELTKTSLTVKDLNTGKTRIYRQER